MSEPTRTPRVDERALTAGTTVRFLLLVALMVVASGTMVLYVAIALSTYDGFACSLAAGVDPATDSATDVVTKRGLQWESYFACTRQFAAPPPWWVPVGWFTLLASLTTALFHVLPRWKARSLVPLAAVDADGALHRRLDELAGTAGLPATPRILVDPVAASPGAVVFGRTRRPALCLHGGLVVCASTDPDRFAAVVLHEFAHIRNGDITITYLTVAMWRVFLAVALPPFVAVSVARFVQLRGAPFWSAEAPIVARGLLLTAVLAVLVYLARAEVLRSREVYADLAAVRWGADPHYWDVTTPPSTTSPSTTSPSAASRVRLALRAFADLWRIHPRWHARRAALTDPAGLFGLGALPVFLTGAAASIISSNALFAMAQYVLLNPWQHHAAALASAGLVTGVVGVGLWRTVVHAALTARRFPSGARTGLWLGLGLVAGGAAAGQGTVNEWLPDRPLVLLVVVLAAIAFTCWLTRCALLWVSAWRGRTLRPVLALSLLAATMALSLWFVWWQTQGVAFTAGRSFDMARARDAILASLIGQQLDHPDISTVDALFTLAMTIVRAVTVVPLALVAVAGLWVVPLLAWAARPGRAAPRWARTAADLDPDTHIGPPLPRLRRVLLAGLLGGLAGWAATAAALAYLRTRKLSATSVTGYMTTYFEVTILALLVGAAVAAAVVCARVTAHRLAATLIATQTAILVGFAGLFVLRATDGCVPAIALAYDLCGWNPGSLLRASAVFLTLTPMVGLVVAFAAVAAVAVGRVLFRRVPSVSARPEIHRMAARRVSVVVICVTALWFPAASAIYLASQAARLPAAADVQSEARQLYSPPAHTPVSAQSAALQAEAWLDVGGDDLLDRFYRDRKNLFATVTSIVESEPRGLTALRTVRPLCADIAEFARTSARYFRVPDQQGQLLWEKFLAQAWQGGQGCVKSLDDQAADPFNAAMRTLASAQDTAYQLDDRLDALIDAG